MEVAMKRILRAVQILYLLLIPEGPFFQHVRVTSVRVKKPIYSIVHMVNSIDKIDSAMGLHANAVQLDVEFHGNGTAEEVHYGSCNCLPIECERRQQLERMLEYIRESTRSHTAKYGNQLCLVVLHLKLEPVKGNMKYHAGVFIAQRLASYLWNEVPKSNAMNVLMSVKLADDIEAIRGANDTVNKLMPIMISKIGYDARDEVYLDKLTNMYKQLGVPGRYWQGEGKSTCLMEKASAQRLQQILDQRDTDSNDRYAQKVYHWVLDIPMDMKNSLQRGVDAIITNRPGRLHSVLKYAFNKTHRLATIVDNPWKWFDGWVPFLRLQPGGSDHLGSDHLEIVSE